VLTVLATSLAGFSTVSAQSGSNADGLVQKLASRFNLSEDEVKAVFDEAHQAREAERQAMISEHLQKAVDDSSITAEQKILIENKLKEIHERREVEREKLKAWAEDNKIDMKYVMLGHGKHEVRLQQAVDDGDITADQKKLIEEKQQELEDARDTMKDEIEKWAEDNDIDQKYLMFGGRGMHSGPGGGRF
jgi:hypothetical protein